MNDEEEDCEEAWESGPFCVHWGDPADCNIECAECGHDCYQHGTSKCQAKDCNCSNFREKDEE